MALLIEVTGIQKNDIHLINLEKVTYFRVDEVDPYADPPRRQENVVVVFGARGPAITIKETYEELERTILPFNIIRRVSDVKIEPFEEFRRRLLEAFPGFRMGDDSPVNGGDLVEWLGTYLLDQHDRLLR